MKKGSADEKLHLTQAAVDKLKATSMQSVFYDSELTGFGLAIGLGGVKTWIVWHRTGKSRRRLARILLGTQPEMTAGAPQSGYPWLSAMLDHPFPTAWRTLKAAVIDPKSRLFSGPSG